MFFRREKPRVTAFEDRLRNLESNGFAVAREASGRTRISRTGFAATVDGAESDQIRLLHAGLAMNGEVALLSDLGYQKVWEAPSGVREPATAQQLRELHDFTEDVREGLGMTSFYNEGLGTVNERHVYDRVLNRDAGVPPRPWERR